MSSESRGYVNRASISRSQIASPKRRAIGSCQQGTSLTMNQWENEEEREQSNSKEQCRNRQTIFYFCTALYDTCTKTQWTKTKQKVMTYLDFTQVHALFPGKVLAFHSEIKRLAKEVWHLSGQWAVRIGTYFLMATFSPESIFWPKKTEPKKLFWDLVHQQGLPLFNLFTISSVSQLA